MRWYKGSRVKVKEGVCLADYTSLKIGGPAQFFSQPRDEQELKLLINLAKRAKIPFRLLGAGTNLLVSDQGVRGLVIHLATPYFRRIKRKGNCIVAAAGIPLAKLLQFSARHHLSGLEFLAGIPGTLGGALVMNAGAWGSAMGERIFFCRVIDQRGRVRSLSKKALRFGYRSSNLAKYIILAAGLKLARSSAALVKDKIKGYLKQRRLTQDLSSPSAGCVFRNPGDDSAGRLIEACGLKGKASGRAVISQRHANFILNLGQAQARDVLRLLDLCRRKVQRKFKITLQPEIKLWQ
jgi:UDP-N-acetylmuramate dehydrogenase